MMYKFPKEMQKMTNKTIGERTIPDKNHWCPDDLRCKTLLKLMFLNTIFLQNNVFHLCPDDLRGIHFLSHCKHINISKDVLHK